jgi:membrane protease YdiL (CAAX protease family)
MDKSTQKSFYSIAKYTTYEILMDGQIASAGAHQARLLEKFKKNKNYIKYQFLALKLVFSFMFVFLPIIPLFTYLDIQNSFASYTINSIAFLSSFVFGIYFGMTFLYLLMFGMVSTSSFMSGNSFKWLQTLPFSKKEIRKIGFMTLFRNLDLPLIILIAAFPIIMLIGTLNILIFLASLLVSLLNVVFNFSLLIILGEKLSFLFSESKSQSKRVNLVRILTMLGYFTIAFGSGLIFSFGFSAVDNFLIRFTTSEPPTILNIYLSLIPFLLAPAYFVTLSTVPNQFPLEILLSTLIGFTIFILVVWRLFKMAQRALRTTISTEIIVDKVDKKEIHVEIKQKSTIFAYIRKDLVSATRDMQSFMFLFFPIFYPLVLTFTLQGPIISEVTTIEGILILWSIIVGIFLFIPPMLVVGLLNLEESGSSVVASLPVIPREQAKAKIILMMSIQGISLTFISILLTILTSSVLVLIMFAVTLPIAWSLLLVMFELKIHFFGKMKYKYILEELNKEHKISKWILMILIQVGLYITLLIIGSLLIFSIGILNTILVLLIVGLTGLSILIFIFTRMFPKEEKIADYLTGGFLREHVNVGTLVLLVLFFIWSFIFLPIGWLILLFTSNLSFASIIFIDFLLNFASFALLWLVAVPIGLKLPRKESFREFTHTIGLSRNDHTLRNILLVIGFICVDFLFLILLTFVLGDLNFNHWYIRNPTPLNLGWFLFITMLIPGIWEEIAFRGVILNLQLRKFSKITTVIANGVIFGIFHLVNLVYGADLYNTLLQVIYASCLGIGLAYLYVNTRNLLPCILIHYLLNSVGQIFYGGIFPNLFIDSVFVIFGVGVLPMLILIFLVKIFVNNEKNKIYSS